MAWRALPVHMPHSKQQSSMNRLWQVKEKKTNKTKTRHIRKYLGCWKLLVFRIKSLCLTWLAILNGWMPKKHLCIYMSTKDTIVGKLITTDLHSVGKLNQTVTSNDLRTREKGKTFTTGAKWFDVCFEQNLNSLKMCLNQLEKIAATTDCPWLDSSI